MEKPILVAGSYQTPRFIVPLGTGIILMALAVAGLFFHKLPTNLFLATGSGALAIAGAVHFRLTRQRAWILPTDQGFLWTSRDGAEEFRDNQVHAMSLARERHFSAGLPTGTTWYCKLWVEAGDNLKPLNLKWHVKLGTPDPLALLVDRVCDNLFERSKRELDADGTIHGEGWQLSRSGLELRDRKQSLVLPLDEITAAEMVDRHLCIWVQGREEPCWRIKEKSENAHLLGMLLGDHLAARPARSNMPVEGLGRILFERRLDRGGAIFGMALGAFLTMMGAALLLGAKIWGLLLVPLGLGLGFFAWTRLPGSFRCHEFGVCRTRWRGKDEIRHEEVQSFKYSAIRTFVKGSYAGTKLELFFRGPGGKEVKYSTTVQKLDESLEKLRDQVARIIAQRLARAYAAGQEVPWTEGLRFLPGVIEYRARGWFGRKAPVLIPLAAVTDYDLQEEVFYLWTRDSKKPAIQEKVWLTNFYPGYQLLTMLLEQDNSQSEPGS